MRNRGRGFTLIELLIIVSIIGIIAAIVIPFALRARANADLSSPGVRRCVYYTIGAEHRSSEIKTILESNSLNYPPAISWTDTDGRYFDHQGAYTLADCDLVSATPRLPAESFQR